MNIIKQKLSVFLFLACAISLQAETVQDLIIRAYDTRSHQEAIRLYGKAIEMNPDMKYAFTGRGLRRQELGDINGAISDFTKAIEIDSLFSDAYEWRAEARMLKGDMGGYRSDSEAAAEAREKGDHALREYDELLKKDPADAKIYLSRGMHKQLKANYKGAVQDFDKYLHLVGRPNNEMVFLWRANAKKALGDVDGALNDYSTALRMFPGSSGVYTKRAALRQKAGDIEGAKADLQQVSEIQRIEKMKRIEKLTRALKSTPDQSYILMQRSKLWIDIGNYTNALSDVRGVRRKNPDDIRAKRLEKQIQRSIEEKKKEVIGTQINL